MKEKVYTFQMTLDWKVLKSISQIDRFDASWASMEKIEGEHLKQLKSVATIQSVGASTRIEGSKLSDEAVEQLLNDIDISKIKDRDTQEVVGYFNVLDVISESYNDIEVQESSIKSLHNLLLKYSQKDEWHKGNYKQHTNAVQAVFPDGSKQIIFKTTEPGFPTEEAIQNLVLWYKQENEVHPLISCALFVYEFLSIHPFQDGNGRLSRLLTTLLLLKSGYKWIEYVSFEHEIENNKRKYYQVLRSCQAQRPNEDVSEWIDFFLDSLINIQAKLQQKLNATEIDLPLSVKEKRVLEFIEDNRGCKSGAISEALSLSKPTVKRILSELLKKELIIKHGKSAGTNYSIK